MLCDTHDTSIVIVDTYVTIPVSPRSRYTAVYRSSTKYRETAQVSRVSTIMCNSYHFATCTLQACDAEMNSKVAENHNYHSTTSARAAVNKYNPISYFCISAALHSQKQTTVYVVTAWVHVTVRACERSGSGTWKNTVERERSGAERSGRSLTIRSNLTIDWYCKLSHIRILQSISEFRIRTRSSL